MASPLANRRLSACLFDMDGTILTSIAATERVWSAWALRHGLDVARFLPTIHGVRALDTIAALALPGVDPQAEVEALTAAEIADTVGVEPIGGVTAFLASLPTDRWAIVTSAPRALALRRLDAAGLVPPAILVTAEDVAQGKPAPDGFLLAAARLGQPIGQCLVFEDAPAGIAAAEAAGAGVVVVTATHHQPIETPHPRIGDYEKLGIIAGEEGVFTLHGLP